MSGARARPSLSWVAGSVVLAVVSVVALVVADFRPPASLVGWVIAGPVAVALLAVYAVRDSAARSQPDYVATPVATWVYRAGFAVTSVAIGVNALSIGVWLGRL